MFRTACATSNAVAGARCPRWGARLSPETTVKDETARRVRQSSRSSLGTSERSSRGSPLRTLLRRSLYLLPILAVLLATTLYVDGARARQRTVAAAYQRAEAAAAARA